MAAKKITGKHLLYGGGAVVLAGGVLYFSQLKRMTANLEVVTGALVHKISLMGITIRLDVLLKNPTDASVKVKFPFVKIGFNGNTIATSEVQNKDFTMPRFGQLKLDPIFITLGFMNLATTAPALLKTYRTTGNLTFDLETITTLNNSIPFSIKRSVKL